MFVQVEIQKTRGFKKTSVVGVQLIAIDMNKQSFSYYYVWFIPYKETQMLSGKINYLPLITRLIV